MIGPTKDDIRKVNALRVDALPEISQQDTFPLWAFVRHEEVIVTRGRTIREAGMGVGGRPVFALPVDAARRYTQNHADGWFYRPMYWLCEAKNLPPGAYGHC